MRTLGWILLGLSASCGASSPPMAAPPPIPSSGVTDASPMASSPPSGSVKSVSGTPTLPRSAVRAALQRGLGVFLQRLELDDQPVRAAGQFHGFRITALRGDAFWKGVDLLPGDVVTRLNGLPIERPEQAQMAFDSLDKASELRLAYERNGQPRELVYAIVDDR